jgi:hypothetical protein
VVAGACGREGVEQEVRGVADRVGPTGRWGPVAGEERERGERRRGVRAGPSRPDWVGLGRPSFGRFGPISFF